MPYVKQITIRQTLNRSLKYIVNVKKTEYGCLVSGMNYATNDRLAYKQMMKIKTHYGKENGLQGFHFVQSFKPHEIQSPYRAHEIGLKWAKKMFGDQYQYIISTHIDKGHLHNHVIINSVSLRGKKFNACKESLKDARRLSDELAKEYNLDIIPENKHAVSKSYKEWKEEKSGTSRKAMIKLVYSRVNGGFPYLVVQDGDFMRTGELYLKHHYEGIELDLKYLERTLPFVCQLWGKPIHLETFVEDKKVQFTYDGRKQTRKFL